MRFVLLAQADHDAGKGVAFEVRQAVGRPDGALDAPCRGGHGRFRTVGAQAALQAAAPVERDQRHTEGTVAFAATAPQFLAQAVEEEYAVGQAGRGVVESGVLELKRPHLPGRDVAVEDHHAAALDRTGRHVQPVAGAVLRLEVAGCGLVDRHAPDAGALLQARPGGAVVGHGNALAFAVAQDLHGVGQAVVELACAAQFRDQRGKGLALLQQAGMAFELVQERGIAVDDPVLGVQHQDAVGRCIEDRGQFRGSEPHRPLRPRRICLRRGRSLAAGLLAHGVS